MEKRKEKRLENILIGVLVLAIVVISAVLIFDITNTITGKAGGEITAEYVNIGGGSVSGYCKEGCFLMDPIPVNQGVVGNLIPINAPLLEVVPLPAGKYQIEFYGGEVGGRRFNVIWVLQSDEAGGDLLFLEVNQEDWGKTINMGEGFDVYEFKTIETDTIPPSLTSFKIVDYSGTQVPLVNNKYTMAGGNYYVDAVFSDNVALSAYSISIQKSLDNGVTWTSIGSCNKINLNSQTIDTYTSSTQDKGCAFTLPAGETGQIKFAVNLKDTSNNLASSGPYYYEMVSEPNIINPGLDSLTGWNVVKDSYTNTGPYVTPKSRIYTPNGYIYVYPKAGTNFVLLPYQSNAKQAPYFEQTITIPSSQAGTYELCAWGVKLKFQGFDKTHFFGWDEVSLEYKGLPPNGKLSVFVSEENEVTGQTTPINEIVFVQGTKWDGTYFENKAQVDSNTGEASFILPKGKSGYSISVGEEGSGFCDTYFCHEIEEVVIEGNDNYFRDLIFARRPSSTSIPQLSPLPGETSAVFPNSIGFIPKNSKFAFRLYGTNFDVNTNVYLDGKLVTNDDAKINVLNSKIMEVSFTANDYFYSLIPEACYIPLQDGYYYLSDENELIFAKEFDGESSGYLFSVAKEGGSVTGKSISGITGGSIWDLGGGLKPGAVLTLEECIKLKEKNTKFETASFDCGNEKPHKYVKYSKTIKYESPESDLFEGPCVYLGYEEITRTDVCVVDKVHTEKLITER